MKGLKQTLALLFALALTAGAAQAASFEETQALAEKGDVNAQRELGGIYEEGKGVPRSYAKAAEWYRKAADQGDASSQFYLGGMYEEGLGVQKNAKIAKDWYAKACKNGFEQACKLCQ